MMPWPLHCKIREEPIHQKNNFTKSPFKIGSSHCGRSGDLNLKIAYCLVDYKMDGYRKKFVNRHLKRKKNICDFVYLKVQYF